MDKLASTANSYVFDSASVSSVYLAHPRSVVTVEDLPDWNQFKRWASATRPAWISTDSALAEQYRVTPDQIDAFLRGELGYSQDACSTQAQLTIFRDGYH